MATLRADQILSRLGLAPSRSKAKRLIEEGAVEYRECQEWKTVKSASQMLPEEIQLRLSETDLLKYVSRSGLKLEGALDALEIRLEGFHVLDVGQSTGGFTDCCLQYGASRVTGVDVGKDQLHKSLRTDSRVTFFEGLNAKELLVSDFSDGLHQQIDFLVCDVSFISLKKIIPSTLFCLKPDAQVLLLVKPQFELGVSALGKGGLVKDFDVEALKEDFAQWATTSGLQPLKFFATKLKGQDGNQEYFLYAKKKS